MFKALRPSSWGLKMIDALFILIVLAILVHLFAPTSGVAIAIHTVCSWIATGIIYIADMIARFLTWL